jgi:hypothetical protein
MDTKIERELRILKAYAITSSLLILALFVMGAASDRKKEKLDEDQPDWPITDIWSLPRSEWPKFLASQPPGHARVYLGRNDDKSAES